MLKLPISAVKLNDENPRTLKDVRFQQLIKSIQEFPQMLDLRPCVVDENHVVLGGNMRLRAMQHLGFTHVNVTVAKGLTEAQKKEFVIKDNGSYGDWDYDALANGDWPDAATLNDWGMDVPADWGVVELPAAEEGEPDLTPPSEPVTVLGDLYEMNGHRLLCGSSTDVQVLERLCDGVIPDLVFTDPPYGVAIVSKSSKQVAGGGATKFKGTVGGGKIVAATEYREIIGDDTTETAQEFYHACVAVGMENFIIWGGNYFTDFLAPSPCWVVWDKQNTGNFADVEMAWTSFDKGAKLYSWLWNGMSRKGDHVTELAKRVHPTQKPVGLFVDIFKDFDFKICFDGFLGSGSTLIAAEAVGRLCYATELDEGYVDTEVRRWLRYMANNNRPATVKRNGTVLTSAELAAFE